MTLLSIARRRFVKRGARKCVARIGMAFARCRKPSPRIHGRQIEFHFGRRRPLMSANETKQCNQSVMIRAVTRMSLRSPLIASELS